MPEAEQVNTAAVHSLAVVTLGWLVITEGTTVENNSDHLHVQRPIICSL